MEGLEGFGGFGGFGKFWNVWSVCGLANGSFETHRKLCCGLGPGVPVGEVALALGCLLGRVFGGFGWRVLEGLESFENFGGFGAFAGWQTAALKAHRKPLLWPWPWGACSGSGLGPGVLAGEGVWRVLEGVWRVWRVWKVWSVCWQTAALKAYRKPLLWPWPWGACSGSGLGLGVPAGDGGWRVWRVLEGLEGLESFGMFGAFAGWQTVALKAHRKLCCGLGPGVPVGEVALALGCLLGRVFGGFGGFWRVWRVLERLERLRAGKRQL